MEKIKSLLDNFNIAEILPKLDALMGHIQPVLRFAILVGPVCLLVLGILYMLLPTREANHFFGYRCYFGMGSQEAWKAAQRIAGIVWTALGLVLLVVMLLISTRFSSGEPEGSVGVALRCALWELGLVAATCIGIDITMAVLFDRNGNRRRGK